MVKTVPCQASSHGLTESNLDASAFAVNLLNYFI